MEHNPAAYYGMNRGYVNSSRSKIEKIKLLDYNYPPQRQPGTNYYQKPKTSNYTSRPVNQEELSHAKEALKSLKAKMVTKPRNVKPNLLMNQDAYSFNRNSGYSDQKPNTVQYGGGRGYNTYGQQHQNTVGGTMPKTTTSNRKPLMGMINFGTKPSQFNTNNIMYGGAVKGGYNNYNNNYNNNNYNNNYTQQTQKANIYNPQPAQEPENQNDERPLDKGVNLNTEKEKANPEAGEPTYPCPDCGRSFVQSVLDKHVKVCKKVFQSKRKEFDSQKKRVIDEEHENIIKENEMKEKYQQKAKPKGKGSDKKAVPKWKKQSEQFRNMIHGGKVESAPVDDYELCKFCNRKYNEEAYKKHVGGCERRFKDNFLKGKVSKEEYNKVMGIKPKKK